MGVYIFFIVLTVIIVKTLHLVWEWYCYKNSTSIPHYPHPLANKGAYPLVKKKRR